ncbi:hypothetical protein [Paenibacillus sp. RC84]|uniref:hypothetical protein n=1 Tax=Paenibacillus sp. RC84 TaxID=3156252 RepID=UPI003518729F
MTLLSLGNPYESSGLAVYGKQEPNTTAGIKVLLSRLEAGGLLPMTTDQSTVSDNSLNNNRPRAARFYFWTC